jgi:hypothetical protein
MANKNKQREASGIELFCSITTGSEVHSTLDEWTVHRCFVRKTGGDIVVFEVAPA